MENSAVKTSMVESIYERLTNEEDARVCTDISDAACRETPHNFVLLIATQFLSKLGDAVASPKIVLAWVMTAIQAPVYLTGLLVPIRESGSLIPQLLIAGFVRRLAVRKWVWVIGSIIQALAVAGMGLVAITASGATAGWSIVALLILFSLARGLCSVASKDVLGKTVPKTRRGRLTGVSAALAGLVTLGLALALILMPTQPGAGFYGALIAAAGGLWLAAASCYAFVREFPGETDGGGNAFTEAVKRMSILSKEPPFRRFVIARALSIGSGLSAPYYVVLAQQAQGSTAAHLLGLFLAASGLASLVSGPFWGRWSDHSSRRVMIGAAVIVAVTGAAVFLGQRLAGLASSAWFVPAAYFVLSIAHAGIRVGRKTYVVDLASGNRRTDYVAVSNTIIGVLLLATGLIGVAGQGLAVETLILLLSSCAMLGALVGLSLPEVENE